MTSATAKPSRVRSRIAWGWIAVSSLSIALLAASPYLTSSLRDLGDAGIASHYVDQPPVILAALYTHIVFGAIALIASPFQFARSFRERYPAAHRMIGRISIVSILIGATAGLTLATVNSAGAIGVAGFGLLAILWGLFAVLGYRAIRRRRVAQHQDWMIRTFAMTYSAVTLRLWIPVLMLLQEPFGVDPEQAFTNAYQLVPFLAWVPNLIVAELIIRRRASRSSAYAT